MTEEWRARDEAFVKLQAEALALNAALNDGAGPSRQRLHYIVHPPSITTGLTAEPTRVT